MTVVRAGICQLASHPALTASHIHLSEEPFVPASARASLSQLATKGVPVDDLMAHCLTEYTAWSETRLRALLQAMDKLDPIPDILVFPEGGLLPANLVTVADWSARHGSVVLAGSHTPIRTPESLGTYKSIGISKGQVKRLSSKGSRNVLPLLRGGKAKLIEKTAFSPFESQIIFSSGKRARSIRVEEILEGQRRIRLEPLICAEALQNPPPSRGIDLVAIVSYDHKPTQFDTFIEQRVRNKTPVVYCNDGAFGGSKVATIEDERQPNWLRDALPRGLPAGDHILVVDLDLSVTAIEVGTSLPGEPLKLVKLASLVPTTNAELSRALSSIRTVPDPIVRAARLKDLIDTGGVTSLQATRMEQLESLDRRGSPSEDWWKALGEDYFYHPGPSLKEFEATLAATCGEHLVKHALQKASKAPELSRDVLEFIVECQNRANSSPASTIEAPTPRSSVLDRDRETQDITRFLDDRSQWVLVVPGLPQVGKTAVIEKALEQAGITRSRRLKLTDSSSPKYIVHSIRGDAAHELDTQNANNYLIRPEARRDLRSVQIIWIENSESFAEFGIWRDEHLRECIYSLIDLCRDSETKLILETIRDLPLDLENPSIRARLRVSGLDPTYSQACLDSHLRRLDLEPDILTRKDKEILARRLGGHPVALAIAADAVLEDGPHGVLDTIKEKRGNFGRFFRRLVGKLNLTEEEQTILRLLTLARDEVPREVVSDVLSIPSAGTIRNLMALGAVEMTRWGGIRIAGILREYFDGSDLSDSVKHDFHSAAARALAEFCRRNNQDLALAVESEYHAQMAGIEPVVETGLIDSALGTARRLFEQQQYSRASRILESLRRRSDSTDILRLSALVEARCNQLDVSLDLARTVFGRSRQETRLLADLARIALTQSQDRVAESLIETAKGANVEDVSILIVEGRMMLRRRELSLAEEAFDRARQLTTRNPWPYFYLGRIYADTGRMDTAIDVLFDGESFIYDGNLRGGNALRAIQTQLGLVYLYTDRIDLAAPIIERLLEDDPSSPEVIRAYAALTIKRDGIDEAHVALRRLQKAKIRSRHDRCQFHLLYGLFYLGIGDPGAASREFGAAHSADRQNVYVMIKWARTLFEQASELWIEGNDIYQSYADDAAGLTRKILEFDPDNAEGISLMEDLHRRFGIDL